MTSDALTEVLETSNLRGRGGAGFPTGRKCVVDRPEQPEAALPRRQRGRVGAGQLQGPRGPGARPAPLHRGLPDHRARDRVPGRLHLHPRRVPGRVRDPPGRGRRGARRKDVFGDVEITVHRGAGAYICGEETALLDVARGQARPAAAAAAVPAGAGALRRPTQINNVVHDRDGADDHRARRGRVREDRPRELAGHGDRLDLRQRRAPWQLRARCSGRRCAS